MTESQIAQWMLDKLNKDGELYQSDVADEIPNLFGQEFVYENDNGGTGISKKVLAEFRKLTENDVVWEKAGRYWRRRDKNDPEGRRQAD